MSKINLSLTLLEFFIFSFSVCHYDTFRVVLEPKILIFTSWDSLQLLVFLVSVTTSGHSVLADVSNTTVTLRDSLLNIANGVAFSDINGDLLPDMLYVSTFHGALMGLLQDLDKQFSESPPVLIDKSLAWGDAVIKSIDYDSDGDNDILTSSLGGVTMLLRNDGTGTFESISQPGFWNFTDAVQLELVDMDNDGFEDIVFLGGYLSWTGVFISFGDANGWNTPSELVTFMSLSELPVMAVSHVTDDEFPDIVSKHVSSGYHNVHIFNGTDRTWTLDNFIMYNDVHGHDPTWTVTAFSTERSPGHPDVGWICTSDACLAAVQSEVAPSSRQLVDSLWDGLNSIGNTAWSLTGLDVTGDGDEEVLFIYHGSNPNSLRFLSGKNESGVPGYGWDWGDVVTLNPDVGFVDALFSFDVDGDGDKDAVLVSQLGTVYWHENYFVSYQDGIVGGLEECDDGNNVVGDGCNRIGRLEWCGDGIINNNGTEQCDDGNTIDGDGCTSTCVVECVDGYVSLTGAWEDCEPCQVGTYSVAADVECVACPAGATTANEASFGATACSCQIGYYGRAEDECLICPDGGVCSELGQEQPVAAEGFWLYESGDDEGTWTLMSCPGGSSSCLEAGCADGYTGFLCGTCDEGYYQLSGECAECGTASSTPLYLSIGLVVIIFLVYKMTGSVGSSSFALSAAVLLNFAQMEVVISNLSIEWPSALVALFEWMSIANFNIELAAPECAVEIDYYTLLKLKILAPAALLVVVVVIALGLSLYEMVGCRKRLPHVGPVAARAVGAYIAVLVVMYNLLSLSTFDLFRCVERESGDVTLYSSPATLCYTEEWYSALPWAITGIGVYTIGVPLTVWIGVRWGMKRVGTVDLTLMGSAGRDTGANLGAISRHSIWFSMWGGISVKKYASSHIDYEVLVMGNKLLMLMTTLSTSLFWQTLAGTLLCFAWIVTIAYNSPYENPLINKLELSAAIATWVTLFSGILFSSGTVPSASAELLLTLLVFASIVAVGLLSLWNVKKEMKALRVARGRVTPKSAKETYAEGEDVLKETTRVLQSWVGDELALRAAHVLVSRSSGEKAQMFLNEVSFLTKRRKSRNPERAPSPLFPLRSPHMRERLINSTSSLSIGIIQSPSGLSLPGHGGKGGADEPIPAAVLDASPRPAWSEKLLSPQPSAEAQRNAEDASRKPNASVRSQAGVSSRGRSPRRSRSPGAKRTG